MSLRRRAALAVLLGHRPAPLIWTTLAWTTLAWTTLIWMHQTRIHRARIRRALRPAVRQALSAAHPVPPTWRSLSSSLVAKPTPTCPCQRRSRAALPARWAAHGPPSRPRPRIRLAGRILPGRAFRSSHDRQRAGRMDAAHGPGHPHPDMSSRCPRPAWLAGPARSFPGPALARPNALACLNRRGHPGCGRRSRAQRIAALPTDDRRSRGLRRGGPLPAGRSRARHVRDRRQPSRFPGLPHHEGPHHEESHHDWSPGADRLLLRWPTLDCPGPDRVGARPCSQRCRGRLRVGHVRCSVPNPARGPAYLGGPSAGALATRRPADRRSGDRQTTGTTCLSGQARPSPSPDAPLPRSSSKLASRPPCRCHRVDATVSIKPLLFLTTVPPATISAQASWHTKALGPPPSTGAAPTKVCPAASYSPTRSPAQYHRR